MIQQADSDGFAAVVTFIDFDATACLPLDETRIESEGTLVRKYQALSVWVPGIEHEIRFFGQNRGGYGE